MAEFQMKAPDGHDYKFSGPDTATDEQASSWFKQNWQTMVEPSTKLERFGTGLADPLYGAAQLGSRMVDEGGMIGLALGGDEAMQSYNKGIETIDKGINEREAGYQAQRKKAGSEGIDWMRGAGNVVSTAPLAVAGGAGIPGAIAGGALGAASEPVTTAKPGESIGVKKAIQAGEGAAGGLALGVAGKALGFGARKVGEYLAREYPENMTAAAINKIVKRMSSDTKAGAPTAQQAIDVINDANREGRPLMLPDVMGSETQGLAGNVSRMPGEGRAIAERNLTDRDQAAPERLRRVIQRYIYGGPDMVRTTEALAQARSADARPLWDDVRNMQGVWSDRLQQFFDDPAFRKGMAGGYEIERLEALAENRPFNPHQMGVDLDQQGNIVLRQTPNMRVIHMGKVGMDLAVAAERNEITGRLSARGVALDRARRAYLQEVDSLDQQGVYRQARAAWAGPSAAMDAIRAGRAALSQSPEAIAAEFNALEPVNQEFYRVGIADMIRERLAKSGYDGNDARAMVRNTWMEEQLRPVFSSPQDASAFLRSVAEEANMHGTFRRHLRGAATAGRLAEDEAAEHGATAGAARVGQAAAQLKPVKTMVELFKVLRDRADRRADPKLNEEIARILFHQGPITPEMSEMLRGIVQPPTTNRLGTAADVLGAAGGAVSPGAAAVIQSPGDTQRALQ